MRDIAPIGAVSASAYTIPTDSPEADGTLHWDSTTLVVVEVQGGGKTGLGYTYTDGCITKLIEKKLAKAVEKLDAMDPPAAWRAMQVQVRNMGREGLAATAISAVDVALWDLKAKLLDLPLAVLLGRFRDAVPIYGSGGFTTYSNEQLRAQLSGWVQRDGCRWVKMKVGTDPEQDPRRVAVAKRRSAIAPHCSWTATAPTIPSRRCSSRTRSRRTRTCDGSRSRCPRTTSRDCSICASTRRRAWR